MWHVTPALNIPQVFEKNTFSKLLLNNENMFDIKQ